MRSVCIHASSAQLYHLHHKKKSKSQSFKSDSCAFWATESGGLSSILYKLYKYCFIFLMLHRCWIVINLGSGAFLINNFNLSLLLSHTAIIWSVYASDDLHLWTDMLSVFVEVKRNMILYSINWHTFLNIKFMDKHQHDVL